MTATGLGAGGWTAAFASPVENRATSNPDGVSTWSNESVPDGRHRPAWLGAGRVVEVRIRLEDPMFQAGANGAAVPLMIGAATVAPAVLAGLAHAGLRDQRCCR